MPGKGKLPVVRKLRVGKKRAIYLPREVLDAVGLSEGDQVIVRAEGEHIVIERAPDPFLLVVRRRMWSRTTVEEFEEESESEQKEWVR